MGPMEGLTTKQRKVLDFIKSFMTSEMRPPTIREIAAHFHFTSFRTVQDYLNAIERKGFIRILRGLSRGIELTARSIGIPLLGRVPAGRPILAEENIEEMLDLSIDYFRARDKVFALRVTGDSMEGAGILDGDLVIVKKQPSAVNRDVVVALVNGEATVKRYVEKSGRKILMPENPNYEPIPLGAQSSLIGKVIGVIRRYAGNA